MITSTILRAILTPRGKNLLKKSILEWNKSRIDSFETTEAKMGKTIKAKFSHGVIEPLEKVGISEEREITVTIIDIPLGPKNDAFKRSAGGWKGSINAEELDQKHLSG